MNLKPDIYFPTEWNNYKDRCVDEVMIMYIDYNINKVQSKVKILSLVRQSLFIIPVP